MQLKKIVFAAIVLLSLLFLSHQSNALVAINGCANLSTGDTYQLTDHMNTGVNTTCFFIWANNSVLDCNTFNVTDTTGLSSTAVFLNNATAFGNITIKNCNFRGFDTNINFATPTGNVTIANNTFTGFDSFGVILAQPNNTNISYNTFFNDSNNAQGININGRQRDAVIFNNTFNFIYLGIQIVDGVANISYNVLHNFSASFSQGINTGSAAENITIIGNNIFNCTNMCVNIASKNTNITSNTINGYNRTSYGVVVQSSIAAGTNIPNRIEGNTIFNFTIYGINVQGNDAHPDTLIANNSVFTNIRAGIAVTTAISTWFPGIVNITSNIIYGSRGTTGAGIYFLDVGSFNNSYVSDNFITNTTDGIFYDSSHLGNITNNTLINNTRGIHTVETNSIFIANNNISISLSDGIFSVSDSRNNISSNNISFTNSAGAGNGNGINLANASSVLIYNNSIWQNEGAAIVDDGAYDLNISRNTIHSNSRNGITIRALLGSVYSNTLFNNSGSGIFTNGFSSARIFANTVYNHTNGLASGIHIFNSNSLTVYDNGLLTNNTNNLVVNTSNSVNITNNTAINGSYGIYLVSSNTSIISSNIALNNTIGVLFDRSFSSNLSSNNLTNNALQIYLNSSVANFTARNYFNLQSPFIPIFNLSTNSFLMNVLIEHNVLETDFLNLSFANSSNVSLRTTNATTESTGTTTCVSGFTCQLVSNLVVINNLTTNPDLQNLTIYYNSTLLTSDFVESDIVVARYNSGWESTGNNLRLNTTSDIVTAIGSIPSLTTYNTYAAVAMKAVASSTSSGSSGGGSGAGGGAATGRGTSSSSSSSTTQTTSSTSVKESFEDGSSLDVTVDGKEINVNLNQYSSIDQVPDSDKSSLQELADEFNGNVLIYEVELPNETEEELVEQMDLVFRIPLKSLRTQRLPDGLSASDLINVNIGCYQVHDDGTRDKLETEETIDGDDLVVTVHVEDNSYFVITAEDKTISEPLVEEQLVKESKLKFIIGVVVILLIIIGLVMFFVIRRKR